LSKKISNGHWIKCADQDFIYTNIKWNFFLIYLIIKIKILILSTH
jgi:hypothetical protein